MFCAPRTLSTPSNPCYLLRSIHRPFGNCVMTWQRSIGPPKRSWCLLFTHDDVKNVRLLAKAQSKEVLKDAWSSFSSGIWLDGNKLYMEQLFNRHPRGCCYRPPSCAGQPVRMPWKAQMYREHNVQRMYTFFSVVLPYHGLGSPRYI